MGAILMAKAKIKPLHVGKTCQKPKNKRRYDNTIWVCPGCCQAYVQRNIANWYGDAVRYWQAWNPWQQD